MTKDVEAELRDQIARQHNWERMTPEEKRRQLFRQQRETLEAFLARNAITRAQYDRGLREMSDVLGSLS